MLSLTSNLKSSGYIRLYKGVEKLPLPGAISEVLNIQDIENLSKMATNFTVSATSSPPVSFSALLTLSLKT